MKFEKKLKNFLKILLLEFRAILGPLRLLVEEVSNSVLKVAKTG